jgi:hypothetical protein
MEGVSASGVMLCSYFDEGRMQRKCCKMVMFSIFGSILLNAYIIYKCNTTDIITLFLVTLIVIAIGDIQLVGGVHGHTAAGEAAIIPSW